MCSHLGAVENSYDDLNTKLSCLPINCHFFIVLFYLLKSTNFLMNDKLDIPVFYNLKRIPKISRICRKIKVTQSNVSGTPREFTISSIKNPKFLFWQSAVELLPLSNIQMDIKIGFVGMFQVRGEEVFCYHCSSSFSCKINTKFPPDC